MLSIKFKIDQVNYLTEATIMSGRLTSKFPEVITKNFTPNQDLYDVDSSSIESININGNFFSESLIIHMQISKFYNTVVVKIKANTLFFIEYDQMVEICI
jgi:hypothetical protein